MKVHNVALFVAHLKAALIAASQDNTRAYMHCVQIELHPTAYRFVSTDGHRLWIAEMPRDVARDGSEERTIILDRVAAEKLARTKADVIDLADLKSLDVHFPPYRQVIPEAHTLGAGEVSHFDPAYLSDACEAFRILAKAAHKEKIAELKAKGILDKNTRPVLSVSVLLLASTDAYAPSIISSPEFPEAIMVQMPRRGNASGADKVRSTIDRFKGLEAA